MMRNWIMIVKNASSHVLPFRALIDACWKEKYTLSRFTRDLIAGITVGIIAIPLAMALAMTLPTILRV